MEIVFFTHPSFLSHQSMPRFASMLAKGMEKRGHNVQVWTAKSRITRIPSPKGLKKWFSYIDQYVLFPIEVKQKLRKCSTSTLFVFTDHALGPWVPLVADKAHAIHCHDFLAQNSALDKIEENKVSWTGKQYQKYIRNGYSQGKYFISVSKKTQQDLHEFVDKNQIISKVVYNGLNQEFKVLNKSEARRLLEKRVKKDLSQGYFLHVGGNQWYKNRIGVIEIYEAWRRKSNLKLPLLLVGEQPDDLLLAVYNNSIFRSDISFASGLTDDDVRNAYSGATIFLFPSLAEGFGWPIAEAMASQVPVITTGEVPMTEVAGDAAFFISKRPIEENAIQKWSEEGALTIEHILNLSSDRLEEVLEKGMKNSKRFDPENSLNEIEAIYKGIIISDSK